MIASQAVGGTVLAASAGDVPLAFIGIGAVLLVLAGLAAAADRVALTAIPLYLVVGLFVGEGGVVPLDIDQDLVELAAEIGVLLLLLTLGLEYTPHELAAGMRTTLVPGLLDAVGGFVPGLVVGLVLGWDPIVAVLLGGVCWISSSGVVSKVLADLGRLGNRETPSVLNLLVFEDLAMAIYLPVVAAVLAGSDLSSTVLTVLVALAAVAAIFFGSMRFGEGLSRMLARGSDEALLLATFGLTLLVAGIAHRLQVSAAIGAFLVGLSLSEPVRSRAASLVAPLRDLFAAAFFLFFAYQIEPASLPGVLGWAVLLVVVTSATKLAVAWYAAAREGIGVPGRVRAGTVLLARGEFSIVIAALAVGRPEAAELGALAAAYVLITAVVGPLATRNADRFAMRYATSARTTLPKSLRGSASTKA